MADHDATKGARRNPISARWSRIKRGAANAMEILREGRLGAPYRAPYDVVVAERNYALRHYTPAAAPAGERPAPVLFVPPLMVTSEIYDISPELSATSYLTALGVDVWLVDFGSPEEAEGGLDRTLDDHILAIDACVSHIAAATGQAVHLVGYSQGGMFCYQAAAYRRSEGIRSVVTFGAPVDLRRNLPVKVHDTLAERLIGVARKAIDGPLKDLQGLPGTISSRGFKLLAPRQEIKHLIGTLGLLHDRDALMAMEPKRRFLGGEGFIAWPGPAFRKFVDEFVVNNRMKDGGFVIAGRTVSLADITVPILYFLGTKDDLARPGAVRAIEKAAVRARCHRVEIPAGHFGMVVGSAALTESWPTVREWLGWVDGQGPLPGALGPRPEPAIPEVEVAPAADHRGNVQRLYDLATEVLDDLWHKLGDVGVEANAVVGAIRWQLPRLARMASLEPHSRVSYSRVLAEQAHAIGDQPFFVWRGRAYTYRDAHLRVNAVAAALHEVGVRRGHRVGVLHANHPDYLTLVGAINRLGAVSVLLKQGSRGESLRHDLAESEADYLACDPEHLETGHAAFGRGTLLLGEATDPLPEHVVDLTARVDAGATLPEDVEIDAGRASDLATLIFTSGTTGLPKAARITNGRWIAAGLGSATGCELTPQDTVYCCLPLYHSTGMLVAVGGALIGGTRLVLAPRFSATNFWKDVRNTGSTVVFYVGELLRYLVAQPPHELDQKHPVRLFAGNGLHADVWRDVLQRFGRRVRILEFYSATEGNVVLLNRTGDKIGSVGREFTGQVPIACVRYDIARDAFARDADGRLVKVAPGEPGVLVARISDAHPLAQLAGYTDADATERRILRDAFEDGDAWFDTGDLLYHDAEGDYFFVDRLGDTFRWKGENVSTELVARVLRGTGQVAHAAVYGVLLPDREGRAGMAAIELAPGAELDPEALFAAVGEHLTPPARPQFLRVVETLELTETMKLVKHRLQQEGADPGRVGDPIYVYDEDAGAYTPLDLDRYVAMFVS